MGQLHRAGHQSEQSMTSVWKSNLPRHIKISFFSATVESVLLHGCECWTLTPSLQKSLDGCDTKMLRVALNIKQDEHITNNRLNVGLPSLSEKLTVRRMRLAGHCHWHRELPAKKAYTVGTNRHRSRGHPTPTYVDVLKINTGAESTKELARCMENWDDWIHRWRTRLRTTQRERRRKMFCWRDNKRQGNSCILFIMWSLSRSAMSHYAMWQGDENMVLLYIAIHTHLTYIHW